jgi:Tfp pilus assembly protein PilW
MSPLPTFPGILGDERGFGMIEVVVSLFTGMIVLIATFSLLDISLANSSRISDRASANQRGRTAMERLLLDLHSSCVSPAISSGKEWPIKEGSEPTVLKVISQEGTEPLFANVHLHEIKFNEAGGTLTDTTYLSTSPYEPKVGYQFPAKALETKTILTGVSKTAGGPVFQYYEYEKETGTLSKTPLTTPLTKTGAENAVKVTITFTVAPESGNTKADRQVNLTSGVVLRQSPYTSNALNEPCGE